MRKDCGDEHQERIRVALAEDRNAPDSNRVKFPEFVEEWAPLDGILACTMATLRQDPSAMVIAAMPQILSETK
jgi:hypothetical protein